MNREINLYNAALAPKVELFSGRTLLAALAGVLGLCLAAWLAAGVQAVRAAQRESAQAVQLAEVQAEVTRLALQSTKRRPDAAVQEALARVEAVLAARNQLLATLDSGALGDTTGVSEYFRALARQKVDGVWLTRFSVANAGGDIVIQGRTLDAALVPGFLSRLRNEEVLRGHSFESLTVAQPRAAVGAHSPPAGYLEFRMATSLREQRQANAPGAAR